jgi:RNA polymerase sigma-70 factor (ECF subfamily)
MPSSNHNELFIKIYHTSYDKVKKYALMIGLPQEDAKDMTQQVFLKLWEAKDKIRLIKSLENYLFVMVKNQYITDLKKRIKRNLIHHHFNTVELKSVNTIELNFLYRETEQILQNCINKLPIRMKQAFLLRQLGYNIIEISNEMNISSRTTINHLKSAKTKIEIDFLKIQEFENICSN